MIQHIGQLDGVDLLSGLIVVSEKQNDVVPRPEDGVSCGVLPELGLVIATHVNQSSIKCVRVIHHALRCDHRTDHEAAGSFWQGQGHIALLLMHYSQCMADSCDWDDC